MGLRKEPDAFIARLYQELYRELFTCAYHALGNASLAEEAIQETFQIACVQADKLAEHPDPHRQLLWFLQYVCRILYQNQKQLDAQVLRSGSAQIPPGVPRRPGSAQTLPGAFRRSGSTQTLPGAFRRDYEETIMDSVYTGWIGETDYHLLKLIIIKKSSWQEAAKQAEIPLFACKKHLKRARKKLRKSLAQILREE